MCSAGKWTCRLTQAQVNQVKALLVDRASRPHQEVLWLHVTMHIPAQRHRCQGSGSHCQQGWRSQTQPISRLIFKGHKEQLKCKCSCNACSLSSITASVAVAPILRLAGDHLQLKQLLRTCVTLSVVRHYLESAGNQRWEQSTANTKLPHLLLCHCLEPKQLLQDCDLVSDVCQAHLCQTNLAYTAEESRRPTANACAGVNGREADIAQLPVHGPPVA